MKLIQVAPSGFVAPYQLGTCMYIKNNYNLEDTNYIGGSSGSWMSVYMASDISNKDLLYKFMPNFKAAMHGLPTRRKWQLIGQFLKTEIPKYISSTTFVDEKRVLVSVSKLDTCKLSNEVTDNYDNLDELMQLCYLSSFIPVLSGFNVPLYKNNKYIDAAFTKKVSEKVDLFVYPTMWGRSYKFFEYIGKTENDYYALLERGYKDAKINRNIIDTKLEPK